MCSYDCLFCFTKLRQYWHKQSIKRANSAFDAKRDAIPLTPVQRILDGEIPRNGIEKLLSLFINARLSIQIGGLTDPAGEYEGQLKRTSDLISLFKDKGRNYPIRISMKGIGLDNDTFLKAVEGYKELFLLISVSCPNEDLTSKIEVGTPSLKKRLTFIKKIRSLGPRIGLRLRPILPSLPIGSYQEVIESFFEAGADVLSVEWLRIPALLTRGAKRRISKISSILGFDVAAYYYANSAPLRSGVLRIKPTVIRDDYYWLREITRRLGMGLASCNKDYRCVETDTPNCCGSSLSDLSWNRMQLSYAVYVARERGEVYLSDILDESNPLAQLANNDNNKRTRYRGYTYSETLRFIWNSPKDRFHPARFFPELMSDGLDQNGDIVFKYRKLE